MKANKLLILLIIFGCILIAGYILRPVANITDEKPALPNITPTNIDNPLLNITSVPTPQSFSSDIGPGQVIVSIGNYNAELPVFVDNILSGNVSTGKPLNLNLSGGSHTIGVCAGTVCETLDVTIKSAIKTTIDFGDRLNKDVPQGTLNISIGDYPTKVPVFIDNKSWGTISPGKPLSQVLSTGYHTVKVCRNDDCFNEEVNIKPLNRTAIDFGERLKGKITQTEVVVSIGGFDAQLPVRIDNVTVGTATMGQPLSVMVNTGEHDVVVCFGAVCEKEQIIAKFGKRSLVDFGERLQKDVPFTKPTARIVSTTQNGNTLVVGVEFINPSSKEVTITATISCQYSYYNANRERVGDSAQVVVTRAVRAGDRPTQNANIYLSGSGLIVSPPVVAGLTIG